MSRQSAAVPAIVIVDDEPDVLQLLQMFVQHVAPAYQVIAAGRAKSGFDLFPLHNVALLITDYNLPDMDGLQLTAKVKEGWPATPVVLITGYPVGDLGQQIRALGVSHVLSKPLPLDQLAQIIHALV